MKESEVLEQAKWKILERGWGQGNAFGANGPCLLGAVGLACGTDEVYAVDIDSPQAAALRYVAQVIDVPVVRSNEDEFDDFFAIGSWNDMEERELTDVLDAFDMAIKLAKEDEALAHAPSTTYQDNSLKVTL